MTAAFVIMHLHKCIACTFITGADVGAAAAAVPVSATPLFVNHSQMNNSVESAGMSATTAVQLQVPAGRASPALTQARDSTADNAVAEDTVDTVSGK